MTDKANFISDSFPLMRRLFLLVDVALELIMAAQVPKVRLTFSSSFRLEPFLESQEISKLLTRRRLLIRFIESLIKKKGEEEVLFDLRRPGGELAVWSD